MKPRKDTKLMEKENLTLYGKIDIVKTLGLAKLTYITSVITIPDEIIKGINQVIFNFICMRWKPAKIKKLTIIGEKKTP